MSKEKSIGALQYIGTSLSLKREFLYKQMSSLFNNSEFHSSSELVQKIEQIVDEISLIENKISTLNSLNEQIQQALLENQKSIPNPQTKE